jgi:NAD(P)-dependent dehydrogenase (short-subunit alcohol dehydrogenase family)
MFVRIYLIYHWNIYVFSRPLHLLILNAGVLNPTFKLTEDGYEEMFQVNYMSQAYLTVGLLASMLTTQTKTPPRVIAISCESHRVE